MRPYGYKSIYTPGYGFSDRVVKWAIILGFAVAAALDVLTITALLMS